MCQGTRLEYTCSREHVSYHFSVKCSNFNTETANICLENALFLPVQMGEKCDECVTSWELEKRKEKRERRNMVEYVKRLDENIKNLGQKFDKVLEFLEHLEGRFAIGGDIECRRKISGAKNRGTSVDMDEERVDEGYGSEVGPLPADVTDMNRHRPYERSAEELTEDMDSGVDQNLSPVPMKELGRRSLFHNNENATPVGIQEKGAHGILKDRDLNTQSPVTKELEEQKAFLIEEVHTCQSRIAVGHALKTLTKGVVQSRDSSKETTPSVKSKTGVYARGLGY